MARVAADLDAAGWSSRPFTRRERQQDRLDEAEELFDALAEIAYEEHAAELDRLAAQYALERPRLRRAA